MDMKRADVLEYLRRLDLPPERYWVCSGAALVLHGLRERTGDIDISCGDALFSELSARGWDADVLHDGTRCLRDGDRLEVIENWAVSGIVMIEGIPVASLEDIRRQKVQLGREKDARDIAAIDLFLNDREEDTQGGNPMADLTFLIEVSARHVHLKQEDVEALFGSGHTLTHKRDLSQPGQFLCEERVDLIGPKQTMKNVAILGPERPASQVELSLTDCRALGVEAPVRESGNTAGSPGIRVAGPRGEIVLAEGVIAAKRHIHMTPGDARAFGVMDKQIVSVAVPSGRPLVFQDVVVRVRDEFAPAMHIDTDEANACLIPREGLRGHLA